MKINIFKRGASLLLAMLMCISTLIGVGLTASADDVSQTAQTVVFSFPRDGDANYTAEWGHDDLSFMNGWFRHSAKRIHIFSIGSWTGNVCYCIEPGTPIANDQILTRNDESFFEDFPSELNNTISPDNIRLFLGRIMQYGYCGTVSTSWRSQNEEDADKMAHAVATQIIVWETIVGERDEYFNHVDPGSYDAILDIISVNHPLRDRIMSYYNSMVRSVQTHTKVPSFCKKSTLSAQVSTLSWNGSKYIATLTDTNNVLGNYTFTTNNSKVTCSVSGNKLTISSNTAINSEVTITANKVNAKRKGVVVWGDGVFDTAAGDIQDLVTYSAEVDDPVVGYVKVKASSGSAKVVKTSEDGKVSGVKFTVVGNGINTTVTTNANGEIVIPNLTAGTYTITELTDDIYNPQQSKTVTVVSGQIATVTFHNTLKFGYLRVYKSAEDNFIEGIKFHLYGTSDSGIEVDEYAITDSNGVANFKNVPIGCNFTLEEIDTEEQYIIPDKQTIAIEWDRVTETEFENILKRGELKVIKTAEDKIIEGIKFRLYGTSVSGVRVDEVAVTDSSGVAYFKNILIGYNYTLEELNTDNKYVTPVSQSATIDWNKVTEQSFYNELKRGSLTVTKTAEDGLVKGITFRLYGTSESGEKVDIRATTDNSGKAYFTDVLLGSNYTLEEVDTENKYITPIKQHVEIEWNKVTEKDFYNELKRGDLTITKNSEDGLVEGITFKLHGTAECGQYVDVYATTDKSGKAHFKDILIGSEYTIEECNCPDRYVIPELQDATIEWESVCEINVYNILKQGTVVGQKLDEDGFSIAGALFGLFKPDETVFTEETALMVSESNEIGVFRFENVPYGNWIIRELKPAPVFVLNEEIFAVSITEDEQVIEITAVNRFICGCVRVWKVDEEVPDSKLSNAVFAVYCDVDSNGEFNAEIDMLVGELTELEAGLYGMDNLRYNGYFLHEEKAPNGFIEDDNYHYFEIRNDGEVIYIENKVGVGFVNEPILGNVQTIKVDEEYPDIKLPGAVFEIYLDTDGDGIFNAETDTLIGEMTETEVGVYTYEALRMGGYFLYEKTAPIGFVKDNNYYYFEITEDDKTVVVENEAGVGFANKPIIGELKILKIDSETNQPLANVGFRVMDTEGSIIEEAYTDENGIVTFELRYSEYTYCEFSPLEGYYATNEVYPFAIIEDGEVIEIEFENNPIPESDPPQTGDDSNMGLWLMLLVLSILGISVSFKFILKEGR